jgi:hypothetical protein
MDTISLIAAAILSFLAFDVIAMSFGSDSRETLLDDHQR